jgi:hypothetical protein
VPALKVPTKYRRYLIMGFTHVFKLNLHRGRVFYELGTHVLEIEPPSRDMQTGFFRLILQPPSSIIRISRLENFPNAEQSGFTSRRE